jgi:hypothetical protein
MRLLACPSVERRPPAHTAAPVAASVAAARAAGPRHDFLVLLLRCRRRRLGMTNRKKTRVQMRISAVFQTAQLLVHVHQTTTNTHARARTI